MSDQLKRRNTLATSFPARPLSGSQRVSAKGLWRFRSPVSGWAPALAAILLSGCVNPMTTRLPTLATVDPRVEKRSFERHDPLPSKTAGPETFSRPRGFIEQRSEIRRTRENARLRGLNRDRIPPTPPIRSSELEYPDTVRE